MEQKKHLLELVSVLVTESKKLSNINGENFNLFSILRKENEELMHSSFITELLNPSGSHNCKDLFLKLFIEYVNKENYEKIINNFQTNLASCKIEKFIGNIHNEDEQGGRLDILINDSCRNIIIENKIHAPDPATQILRYFNYNDKNGVVLYLTLYGTEPSEKSARSLKAGNDYYCISYNKTILNWIKECREKVCDKPILRESLKQYEILIKKLTGQLINQEMIKEVKRLILENIESAEVIHKFYNESIEVVKEKFREHIKNELEKEFEKASYSEFKFNVKLNNEISHDNAAIFIHSKTELVRFGIETFNGSGWLKNLHIGIWINFANLNEISKKFIEEYAKDNKLELKLSRWWLKVKDLNINLGDNKIIVMLNDENKLNEKVSEIFKKVISFIDDEKQHLKKIEEIIERNN